MEFYRTFRIWILLLCLIISTSAAYADTITVGPGGPGAGYDYGTIQEGIDAAVNGDTVVIAPGTYTGSSNKNLDFGGRAITLRSTDPEDPCVVAATIIDCEDDGRGFYFHSGEGRDSIIDGLTITRGYISSECGGGGMYCDRSGPTLRNCVFKSNSVSGPGGGIENWHSNMLLQNCFFIDNSSSWFGGGIYNDQSNGVTLINCTFTANSASDGGGIYNKFGQHNLTNCKFNGNTATKGGGIANYYCSPSLTNCTFSENTAWGGGGMWSCDSDFTLKNCLFTENSVSQFGGGMYNLDWASPILINCTFYGNSAGSEGGGIRNYNSSVSTLTNCIFWNNSDDGGTDESAQIHNIEGGGATVNYSCIQGNWSGPGSNNIDSDPCFVSGPDGDFYLSQITAGQAVDSNCVDAGSDTAANLGMDLYTTRTDRRGDSGVVDIGYHYQFNPADTITVGPGGPGAAYDYGTIQEGINAAVNGDTVIIAPGVYTGTNNKNLDFGGRAITVRSTDPNDPCVVDTTIIDCEDDGRGFYFHSGESNNSIISGLTIVDGKIEATSDADNYGGGILCQGSSPRIENCCILSNVAYGWGEDTVSIIARSGYGGGVACILNSHTKIVNCKIKYNGAVGIDFWVDYDGGVSHAYGGGVYCDSQSSVEIINSEVSHNTANAGAWHSSASFCWWPYGSYGGGVYAGNATIKNCLIFDNRTRMRIGEDYEGPTYGDSRGAGIYCGSSSIISNCTIYGNDTDYQNTGHLGQGGGIYCSSPTVIDSIIWANDANEQIYGSATVTYSDVQGGFTGTDNIDSDPCFVSGPGGDFYLSQIAAGQAVDSNCVDAGSDTAANLGMDIYTTRTDRVADKGIVDIGYHYQFNPADIDGDGDVDFIDYALFADDLSSNSKTIPKGSVEVDGQLDEWTGDIEWMPLDKVYFSNPDDVNEARFALQWDPNTNKIYAAIIIIDTNHVFLDEYNEWDASDRIEIYSQGDDAGGSDWYGVYDAAQHYMVGPNTSGGWWGTWALGQTIVGDEGLEYTTVVNGNEVVYEIGVRQFDNYGGFSGGDTIVTSLAVGHVVRFDIVADTRWEEEGFGMLSENLLTGKYYDADRFARYMLVEQLGGPPCFERASDLDKNCIFDFKDLAIFAKYWLWGK